MKNLVNIKILGNYSIIEAIIIFKAEKAFENIAIRIMNEYFFGKHLCNLMQRNECNDSSLYCFICKVSIKKENSKLAMPLYSNLLINEAFYI